MCVLTFLSLRTFTSRVKAHVKAKMRPAASAQRSFLVFFRYKCRRPTVKSSRFNTCSCSLANSAHQLQSLQPPQLPCIITAAMEDAMTALGAMSITSPPTTSTTATTSKRTAPRVNFPLPRELRDQIYDYLLDAEKVIGP